MRSYEARQEALAPVKDLLREQRSKAITKDPIEVFDVWSPIDMWGRADCELCGEKFKAPKVRTPSGVIRQWEEIGEFWKPDSQDSVIAHAQCGLDAGLELA